MGPSQTFSLIQGEFSETRGLAGLLGGSLTLAYPGGDGLDPARRWDYQHLAPLSEKVHVRRCKIQIHMISLTLKDTTCDS